MSDAPHVKLRPLEREDLRFVHQLDNNASVMRYWFEEPYEAFVELSDLYDKHIHDQSERRFVIECDGEKAGLVELVEINHVHRRAEFQIIISPEYQGLWTSAPSYHLNSVTSVSHFSFGFCAWKSRFSLFSATCCGLDALRVQP